MTQQRFAGWGRTAATWAKSASPASIDELGQLLADSRDGVITRGLGRSYGDAAQNAGGTVVSLAGLRGIEGLERADGTVTCGGGLALIDLINAALAHGWFIPVSPGTSMVTVGGAIAADVHGKNHHNAGSFGDHVRGLTVMDARGALHTLAPGSAEFAATIGGMGLTGVIVSADIAMLKVPGASVRVSTRRTADFDATVAALRDADAARYSVAWLDSLATGRTFGRGVVTFGDHAPSQAKGSRSFLPRPRVAAPAHLPSGLLNRRTVGAFNSVWWRRAPRARDGELQSIREFFHPLDSVADWNRVYGSGGLVQYQFVVPEAQVDVLRRILERFAAASVPSFLTVLKRFGRGNESPLSFPIAGWTLAVDIPAGIPGLASILNRADDVVASAGGRVYLAKDSRMSADSVRAMYPRLEEFLTIRRAMDPDGRFTSDLARRLMLL